MLVSKFSSLKNFDAYQAQESLSTEDADEAIESKEEKRKWFIIDHESKNKQIWNMFTNIFYMVSFFTFPLVIAFDFETLD